MLCLFLRDLVNLFESFRTLFLGDGNKVAFLTSVPWLRVGCSQGPRTEKAWRCPPVNPLYRIRPSVIDSSVVSCATCPLELSPAFCLLTAESKSSGQQRRP
jgi:hypothetical protein